MGEIGLSARMPLPAMRVSFNALRSMPCSIAWRTRTSSTSGGLAYSGRNWTSVARNWLGTYSTTPAFPRAFHSRSTTAA